MKRTCKDCGLSENNLELFVKDSGSKYGRRNLCRPCGQKRNNSYYNSEEIKRFKSSHQVYKRYGITLEEYEDRMATSDCCEICEATEDLCYDHCHISMKFRGVLCRSCNRSIGQLGDTYFSVYRAVEYLKRTEN